MALIKKLHKKKYKLNYKLNKLQKFGAAATQHYGQPPYGQPSYGPYTQSPWQPPVGPPPPLASGQPFLSTWFDHFDRDRNGTLDREEIINGLQHTLAQKGNQTNPQVLRDTVYSVWPMFDRDGNGVIDRFEFCVSGGVDGRVWCRVYPDGS